MLYFESFCVQNCRPSSSRIWGWERMLVAQVCTPQDSFSSAVWLFYSWALGKHQRKYFPVWLHNHQKQGFCFSIHLPQIAVTLLFFGSVLFSSWKHEVVYRFSSDYRWSYPFAFLASWGFLWWHIYGHGEFQINQAAGMVLDVVITSSMAVHVLRYLLSQPWEVFVC